MMVDKDIFYIYKIQEALSEDTGKNKVKWSEKRYGKYLDRLKGKGTPHIRNRNKKYSKWRTKVLKRDDYHCVLCDSVKTLHTHHKEGYTQNPLLRYDVDNGVTLCKMHHKIFHTIYGTRNNTEDQWRQFYSEYKE
jgi:predicted restriction endonuclease